ncbi:hypothetical protein IGI04_019966, partial [Brassica rapa subsp. trilocularis]
MAITRISFGRYYKLEAGRELSRTGSKHDGIEARQENPKFGENPNFGIHLEFIKNIHLIRTGVEKYSGLIAGRKFTGRVEISRMDREARAGLIYEIRTSTRCRETCDRSMLSDMCALSVNLDEVRPWIRHLEGMVSLCMMSWSCHQTCGARGAATHASGAMRGDTRAATRLRKLEKESSSFDRFRVFSAVFENSYSTRFESTSKRGSARLKISSEVGLLVKVKKGFGMQKTDSGSRPRSTKNSKGRGGQSNYRGNSGVCYTCGQPGHISRVCPNNQRNNQQGNQQGYPQIRIEDVTCFSCGKKGHYASSCPNKPIPATPLAIRAPPSRPAIEPAPKKQNLGGRIYALEIENPDNEGPSHGPITGREVSTTGSKHDGKTQSLAKTLILGIIDFSKKPEAREIFSIKVRIHLEFIKNIHLIRTGVEKYSGLIAGRKFTGRVEISRMDREARAGLIYEIRTSTRCRETCDRSMLSDMCALSVNLDEVRPWIRHLEGMVSLCMMSWSCHQTCGSRGAATHASGAMRGDTRAATRLRKLEKESSSFDRFRVFSAVFENSYSTRFESTSKRGSARLKISSEVGLLVKVKNGFGTQKTDSGSRPRSTKNSSHYLEVGSWQEA